MPRISGLASAWSHTARLAAWAAAIRLSAVGSAVGEGLLEVPDRRRRGHLAGRGAAHAVGDREERSATRSSSWLLVRTRPTSVAAPARSSITVRTSMVVLPNWSLSPLRMATVPSTLFSLR